MAEAKVACRTPNPGKPGVTNIPEWRFNLVSDAIRNALRDGDLEFTDLPGAVKARLSDSDLARLGSLGWNVTTVKLELEVRGEVERIPGFSPQRLRLAGT